ncbi:MAG: hypothetical protein CM15mP120_23040 [Pseudomonadota bacterium]|nr:MAG: hypothetical protein CM15mP120_23040 [Pseudomonadota bacterium]
MLLHSFLGVILIVWFVPGKPFLYPERSGAISRFFAGEPFWGKGNKNFPVFENLIDSGELKVDFEIATKNPFKRISRRKRRYSKRDPPKNSTNQQLFGKKKSEYVGCWWHTQSKSLWGYRIVGDSFPRAALNF